MSSLNNKNTNFSLASYELPKPYPQLDRHSDNRRNIPEGGLATDKVLGMNIKPQDNVLQTIIIKAPSPQPILSTFSFLVSFEKFHMTATSKAGYNKIYEFRRSKSFFFEVIDHIPDTNEIHLKIYTNDNHMLSTPIRFHFGIYVACNQLPTKKFPHQKPTPCRIPCPFVKNFNRHACIQHHSRISQDINLPMEEKVIPTSTNNIIHHKSFHANIIYEKYNNNSRQQIFSNRLGISYTTRYEVHDLNAISPPNKAIGPMYTKIYKNFSKLLSSNSRTAAK
ncbi:hypothetical protein GLOIN_2v1871746 [Rhizophagus irregularis DAOM 181602=DAOM 197198]|nr:hypothetical protein RirG_223070 [Rhizophagus irregularis DAOM 197198w]GBC22212.1 hypothetical protein GLOIN_2v1871746 [Rhizophagus irregularis DAOM 181602=DAOM 197198]